MAEKNAVITEIRSRLADFYNRSRLQLPHLPQLLQRLLPIIVLAIALTALLMIWIWRDAASYKPVFGSQEKVTVAEMVSVLDAEGIAYRIHPHTGQILVPESKLGEVRMLLAAKGVVAKLPEGLELLDKSDPLGVSQFVQNVRFRRGLEGELTKSIMALDPVEEARVHLSISRPASFVIGDGEKSSASVMVVLKPQRTLSQEQIAAIINLVSGSVANLEPQRVTLVDQAGHFLSSRVDFSDTDPIGVHDELAVRFREQALRNVRELLATTLGEGNFKVSVTADVNNDRIEETREQYGHVPKITHEAIREEQGREGGVMGVPGSLSNQPVHAIASAVEQVGRDIRSATTRQYAYDRNITQIKHGRGRLKKLSVAVIINNAVGPQGGWTAEQLLNFDKILRSGLGMDASRGDSLVVSTLTFPSSQQPLLPWWKDKRNLLDLGSYLLYALALWLVFFFLIRPLLKLVKQRLGTGTPVTAISPSTKKEPMLKAPMGKGIGQHQSEGAGGESESMRRGGGVGILLEQPDWPPIDSNMEVLVAHLKTLVTQEPERVSEVVKQWVQKHG